MPVRNGLSTTSMVLGVLSLIFFMMGLSIPIGALGVITALLSRGNQQLDSRGKIGLAASLAGIAMGICVVIWSFNVMSTPEFNELLQQYQELYGLSGQG